MATSTISNSKSVYVVRFSESSAHQLLRGLVHERLQVGTRAEGRPSDLNLPHGLLPHPEHPGCSLRF